MSWIIEEKSFNKENTALNGNKFLLGNGYMGYRGTMEEFEKEQMAACTLAGVYDRSGDKWRELVNAPNGLFTRIFCDGELLSVLSSEVKEHSQSIDIQTALHKRNTTFMTQNRKTVFVNAERFLSFSELHLMCMKYSFITSEDCRLTIETGIDGDVWDINGPHLQDVSAAIDEGILLMRAATSELGIGITVAEGMEFPGGNYEIVKSDLRILRKITLDAKAGKEYSFVKYAAVYTSQDGVSDPAAAAKDLCKHAIERSYDASFSMHTACMRKKWESSDVVIEGDDNAQLSVRYSIYHLLIIAPTHSEKLSIPARGLSGQVYKGAVFWDTEMFMLPFYIFTEPEVARNIVKYRCHTLGGARRKAREYGFRGAFYAWESQETGDDACTHFNVTDVFTGRPMRTYFRDKQVHISADVVYGIWQYYLMTEDESLLLEGGAEVILECARFFYSYSYFNSDKKRFEILDVTGPDEYHERVNNNAYTNVMVKYSLDVAVEAMELLSKRHPEYYEELITKLDFAEDLQGICRMRELLYIPEPDNNSLVIEQFDRYHTLEDIGLKELKSRVLNPNEYLGGGNGLATTTKVLKQADTVLMLNLFKDRYTHEVKKANWEYYEPRTEHGSSLSPCVYALLASDIGNPDWGYKYFMKTASIDLTGESKQYVGTLYIGGTHPAANGGAWMAAVLGFGGVRADDTCISIDPRLPEKWKSISFNFIWKGQKLRLKITRESISIKNISVNADECRIDAAGKSYFSKTGEELEILI